MKLNGDANFLTLVHQMTKQHKTERVRLRGGGRKNEL